MKNIENHKNKLEHIFSKKYFHKDLEHLNKNEYLRCSYLAEMWAYI